MIFYQTSGESGRNNNPQRRIAGMYFVINGFVYLIWIILIIIVRFGSTEETRTSAHITEVFFASGVAIVSAIVFLIYGKWIKSKYEALAKGMFVPTHHITVLFISFFF